MIHLIILDHLPIPEDAQAPGKDGDNRTSPLGGILLIVATGFSLAFLWRKAPGKGQRYQGVRGK
jgi:hypothetical protein